LSTVSTNEEEGSVGSECVASGKVRMKNSNEVEILSRILLDDDNFGSLEERISFMIGKMKAKGNSRIENHGTSLDHLPRISIFFQARSDQFPQSHESPKTSDGNSEY
jgi:hypothetical protein